MPTIPDSNVVLDIIREDPQWFKWSALQLQTCRNSDTLIVNAIIVAESAAQFVNLPLLRKTFQLIGCDYEEIGWDAAYAAGLAHVDYRAAGGQRLRTLPDFLIGAHASSKGYRILTRDASRYRSYFPNIEVIAPDTHP